MGRRCYENLGVLFSQRETISSQNINTLFKHEIIIYNWNFSQNALHAPQTVEVFLDNVKPLSSDSKQSTGRINMKPTRVTPAGLEVLGEVPTAF